MCARLTWGSSPAPSPSAAQESHQDAGVDGRRRQDVISEQPGVALMAHGWEAVIMDLKDKAGTERQ